MFQYTNHQFSSEQIIFLNRGPTYVPPCQMHILSSSSTISLDQILTKQIAPLRRQLTRVFTKYPVDLSRRMKFEEETQKLFHRFFSLPIPSQLKERALYEKDLIQSIQKQLRQDQLILRRTADDKNTYYLGQQNDFNFKTNEYLQNSDCFEIIGSIDVNHTEEQHLNEILRSIDSVLNNLLQKKLFTKDHLTKLSVSKRTNMKLPHLYFLPEINQDDGSILYQPRISSCINAPIQILATYLEQLLYPLLTQISQSITFNNGGDFMKKLQHYCFQQEFLRSTTHFITFEIHHLYSHLSHTDLLTGVHHLLFNPVIYKSHHNGLKTDGIEALIELFLRNNVFTYNGKIYRYTKGCSLNFSLTRLLVNIYLHHWQFTLLRSVRIANEFFGLYHNTGFLTWNKPLDQIQMIFEEINRKFESPIQLTTSIGSHVHYLNSDIENINGHLSTRVYYDPNKQAFLLPYFAEHPRLLHRQWFRFALVRAGLYCTTLEDFHDEQLYIELTFLANDYSLDFVEYHIRQFFRLVNPINPEVPLDKYRYNSLRSYLFRYHSTAQKSPLVQQQEQVQKNRQLIQLHYLFDWGSRREFNEQFIKNWIAILERDPKFKEYGLDISLHSKHCYLSNTLLTH